MHRRIPVRALLFVVAASCALLLILPGQTVTTRYLNDLFVILDGAYRVVSGQVPSRDFHTPLGPLAYYLPAAGYALSGTLGGAMPAAMALAILAFSVPLLHILGSRLHPVLALLFGVFLLLILAVPINLGEGITALSFAKFYNRIGWIALSILIIMYLRPIRMQEQQDLLDTLCATGLALVMIYTKLTYGIAAVAFLIFMLTDRHQRRWVVATLGLLVITCIAVEIIWQSSRAYLDDLRLALNVGGRLRGTWGQITDHILGNLTDYVLLTIFAGLALARTRSMRDGLFYLFCALAGFLIINQNFQVWGIIILHAASAVAAETILRFEDKDVANPIERHWSIRGGTKLLFLALVLPTIVHCTAALGLHMISASIRAGQSIALPHLEQVRVANLWTWGEYDTAHLYLTTLRDGAKLLSEMNMDDEKIFVLDLANPFPMILNTPPPKGDMPWLQWERTLNTSAFIPAGTLMTDVTIMMEPKPIGDATQPEPDSEGLKALYGSYIADHFEIARETDHWKVYRRRPQPSPGAFLNHMGSS
ncbi:hypothetical protein AA309_03230 [Microvirga vignae]|uniref:Glycosyltransferase RgtA/B/C/D-like domain-containing protein n=1 Tax=Microvirga vignae TaxID=1225564 RepID=A0A0H1RPA7_9HYPH|nr:hypothetical protein [Microvirga vignae]KLK94502.1 hypothetical protein AA309_03230 [Microvirga vignae]